MNLDSEMLSDASRHYYVPEPSGSRRYLYHLISVGHFECFPAYRVQRYNFRNYLLLLMLKERLWYNTGNDAGVIRAGQILLLDCNTPHSYGAFGECAFMFFHFNGAQSKELCDELIKSCGNVYHLENASPIMEWISDTMLALSEKKEINEIGTSARIYETLMALMSSDETRRQGTLNDIPFDRVLTYIFQHLDEKLTVNDLAAVAGYSAGYFSHRFAEIMGVSVYRFVMKCRIERAEKLLQTTKLSVQEIALQTGFPNAANFSYAFRGEMHMTPTQYRSLPF